MISTRAISLHAVRAELLSTMARTASLSTPDNSGVTQDLARLGLILTTPTAFDMDSTLKLTPLLREGTQNANGPAKSERHFLDFVVDGESLWGALGKRHDMVSIDCTEYSADHTEQAVGRLLLNEKADLPNDRRSFFVCSECGDLGCGAITAVVGRKGETITWKTFGYENTYEDRILLDAHCTVGPFTFNATAYERTLVQALALLRRTVS
jgi:hypothetical protein